MLQELIISHRGLVETFQKVLFNLRFGHKKARSGIRDKIKLPGSAEMYTEGFFHDLTS